MATQAPTGSNQQGWHWMIVTDPDKRKAIGGMYQQAFDAYRNMPYYAGRISTGDPVRDATQQRVASLGRVPRRAHGGRARPRHPLHRRTDRQHAGLDQRQLLGVAVPAAWSFCLAARARELGTSWTSLHLMFEKDAADVLGIPYDTVSQGALFPVAYTKGTDFKPAPRIDLDPIVHVDSW